MTRAMNSMLGLSVLMATFDIAVVLALPSVYRYFAGAGF